MWNIKVRCRPVLRRYTVSYVISSVLAFVCALTICLLGKIRSVWYELFFYFFKCRFLTIKLLSWKLAVILLGGWTQASSLSFHTWTEEAAEGIGRYSSQLTRKVAWVMQRQIAPGCDSVPLAAPLPTPVCNPFLILLFLSTLFFPLLCMYFCMFFPALIYTLFVFLPSARSLRSLLYCGYSVLAFVIFPLGTSIPYSSTIF
jgi:hypothetical protein